MECVFLVEEHTFFVGELAFQVAEQRIQTSGTSYLYIVKIEDESRYRRPVNTAFGELGECLPHDGVFGPIVRRGAIKDAPGYVTCHLNHLTIARQVRYMQIERYAALLRALQVADVPTKFTKWIADIVIIERHLWFVKQDEQVPVRPVVDHIPNGNKSEG